MISEPPWIIWSSVWPFVMISPKSLNLCLENGYFTYKGSRLRVPSYHQIKTCLASVFKLYLNLWVNNTRDQSSSLHWRSWRHQFKRAPLETRVYGIQTIGFLVYSSYPVSLHAEVEWLIRISVATWRSETKSLMVALRFLRVDDDRKLFSVVVALLLLWCLCCCCVFSCYS